jgi:uncharacterized membrane protein YfcA
VWVRIAFEIAVLATIVVANFLAVWTVVINKGTITWTDFLGGVRGIVLGAGLGVWARSKASPPN